MYNIRDKVLYRGIMAEVLNLDTNIEEFLESNPSSAGLYDKSTFLKVKLTHFPGIKLVVMEDEITPHDGSFVNDLSLIYSIILDFNLLQYITVEDFLKDVYNTLDIYFDEKCKELLKYDIILTRKELVTARILGNVDIINSFTAMKDYDYFTLEDYSPNIFVDLLENSIIFENTMFKRYKKYLEQNS